MFTETRRLAARAAGLALTGLVLLGCNAPPVSVADYPSFGEVKVLFIKGQSDQRITVRALDRLAITSAELVAPDGSRIEASSIDAVPNPTIAPYGQGDAAFSGIAGQVQAVGSLPMPSNPGAPTTTTVLVGQTVSVALIDVPELPVYNENWRQSKVVVRLGIGDETRTETLPAPAPPP
jgi:hypothetical protein